MISVATIVCLAVAAVAVRPWRVRPRVPSATVGSAEGAGRGVADRAGSSERVEMPTGPLKGLVLVGLTVAHPLLGLVGVAMPLVRRGRERRVDQAATERSVTRTLPEVVDLIVLGVGAGLTTRAALARSEPWLPEPFRAVFIETRRRAGVGQSFAVALESSAAGLGATAQPLIGAVLSAEQTVGSNLATLIRVGDEARRRRRVEAQERARRLPVTMLLPLVLCVLPAFGLLAVAPLVMASLRDIGFGP